MKRKITLTIIILLITVISVILIYPKEEKEILDTNKEIKNKFISMMLEDELESGKYIEKTDSKFPLEGYSFNSEKSGCENGGILSWNSEKQKIEASLITSDKCYAYFDKNSFNVEYSFTGNYETFIAPVDGEYKIELWGASGGNAEQAQGGKGAYAKGNIKLANGDILYIFVGESGRGHAINSERTSVTYPSTFNGGGKGHEHEWTAAASGGGATDIRLKITSSGSWNDFDSLKSRIMVAAGGGGGFNYASSAAGGYGGTLEGGEGIISYSSKDNDDRILENATGGTQTSGGETNDRKTITSNGKYGVGGNYYGASSSGGGSGYYGGAGGIDQGLAGSAGGGGSSFISGYPGCNAISESSTENAIVHTDQPVHYSGKVFTDSEMIAGNETMPNPYGGTEEGHTGKGYAKITLIK